MIMSSDHSKNVWTEDGRSGEKRIKEVVGNDGTKTIYEELWVAPKPPEKRLHSRVTKHVRPVVHTVETELVDEDTQEVLDRKVESIDPESKMEIRRHIKSEATLSAMSVEEESNCYVTRDELKDAIVQAVRSVHEIDDCYHDVDACSHDTIDAQSLLGEKYDSGDDKSGAVWTVVLISACVVLTGGILGVLLL
jgi:hypothetical protein